MCDPQLRLHQSPTSAEGFQIITVTQEAPIGTCPTQLRNSRAILGSGPEAPDRGGPLGEHRQGQQQKRQKVAAPWDHVWHTLRNLCARRGRREGRIGLDLVLGLAIWCAGNPAAAQSLDGARLERRWSEAAAGSEVERYLRLAATGGDLPSTQWSIRPFGPREDPSAGPQGPHPWGSRFRAAPKRGWWVVRPAVDLLLNSGFPLSLQDGPIWSSRGLTASVTGGIAARYGPLSVQLAPQLWWTQNRPFDMLPPIDGKRGDFASWGIDLPQRLAPGPLGRLDPGESVVRLDAAGLSLGISTASEWWGPGIASGIMFSNNAGGMPRIFAGTNRPLDVFVGRVHGRVVAGRLARSGEFPQGASASDAQLLSGLVGIFQPKGLSGLELGVTRLFHSNWPEEGPRWRDLRILISPVAPDVTESGFTPGNQLASIFARLAVPNGGTDLYVEFARDDHNSFDNLDLITEPEHDSALMFGFQHRLGALGAPVWWAVRGETVNGRMSHLHRVRTQVLLYSHGEQIAGHTLRGQLLGSPSVRGGSGAELGVDRYDADGRLGVRWWRQGLAVSEEGGLGYGALQSLEASMLRFTAHGDLTVRLGLTARVGVTSSYDATNVQVALGWRPRR